MFGFWGRDIRKACAMVNDQRPDRSNDTKLLTPLLLMGLIIVCGFLFYAVTGHPPTTHG